jgi:hypothetical protein
VSRTRRVGVVADSHVGEFLDRLPDEVLEVLEGCDLVLHAGDLSVPGVIDDLAQVAPVVAVRGDHDRLDGLALPRAAVAVVGGWRIGITHGDEGRHRDVAVLAAHVLAGRRIAWRGGLREALVRRLGAVDCVAYGHWHEPDATWVGSTLLFSPGAVCPWGSLQGARPPRRGVKGVGDRGVRRYRHQLGADAMTPRVGVLHVGSAGIRPQSIPLRERPRTKTRLPGGESQADR